VGVLGEEARGVARLPDHDFIARVVHDSNSVSRKVARQFALRE
jgi:hypothetical protein